jgi:hypothetical protein
MSDDVRELIVLPMALLLFLFAAQAAAGLTGRRRSAAGSYPRGPLKSRGQTIHPWTAGNACSVTLWSAQIFC